jgi:hypothetical protein
MNTPFPGMDPYLEHAVIWEGVHSRLAVAIANQLQPHLDPRYIASVEERVFIEEPQQRIPDVWIQQNSEDLPAYSEIPEPVTDAAVDTAVIVEVQQLEIHQKRIEILDAYNDMKLITSIDVLSPTNKRPGPGRESSLTKQKEVLERDCHLVEIDLLRDGQPILSIPQWRLKQFRPFHCVVCVSRWPRRTHFEVHPRQLQQRLPRIAVPHVEPDPDVPLDVQAALEEVYVEGRYARRLRYEEPCQPPLEDELQQWANECLVAFLNAEGGTS